MKLRLLFEPTWVRYLAWVIFGWLIAGFLILAGSRWYGLDAQSAPFIACTVLGLFGGWARGFYVRPYRHLMFDVQPAAIAVAHAEVGA